MWLRPILGNGKLITGLIIEICQIVLLHGGEHAMWRNVFCLIFFTPLDMPGKYPFFMFKFMFTESRSVL